MRTGNIAPGSVFKHQFCLENCNRVGKTEAGWPRRSESQYVCNHPAIKRAGEIGSRFARGSS